MMSLAASSWHYRGRKSFAAANESTGKKAAERQLTRFARRWHWRKQSRLQLKHAVSVRNA